MWNGLFFCYLYNNDIQNGFSPMRVSETAVGYLVKDNLLTVRIAASQSGLQVKGANEQWLDVPVGSSMLSINIGDMLETVTEGYYKSTLHQVINPLDGTRHNSRYSISLFLHPRDDVKLTAEKTAGEFLDERLRILGVKK